MNRKELRYLRLKNGLLQSELSAILRIARNRYSRIERGFTIPTVEECEKIALFFGVSDKTWKIRI